MPDDDLHARAAPARALGWTLNRGDAGLWLFLLLLVLFFAIMAPGFMSTTNGLNVLRQMSVLAIAAFGASFVIFSGGLDLSVGANAALSGVLAAMAARVLDWPGGAELSWTIGVLVGAAFGLVNGLIITRLHISPIITTLGTLTIGRGLALLLTGGVSLFGVPTSFQGLGRGFLIPGVLPIPVLIMVLVLILAWIALRRSAFGVHVYSVGGNEEAARLSGIAVDRVKLWVYVIGGATAGLAGVILASRLGSGQAASSEGLELLVIAAVVLGGASITGGQGSIWGTLAGVLIISVLANGMSIMNVEPFYQRIVTGLALLIAVGMDQYRKRRAGRSARRRAAGGG
jgi:ribose/xylose/arabinose/galactoside ABC-type transport system permease subunit